MRRLGIGIGAMITACLVVPIVAPADAPKKSAAVKKTLPPAKKIAAPTKSSIANRLPNASAKRSNDSRPALVDKRHDPEQVAAQIDQLIDQELKDAAIPVTAECTDVEFHRRVTLDLVGRIPTAVRTRSFLDDQRSDKRARLIDELLASASYGEHFGEIWHHLLIEPNADNMKLISERFADWMGDQLNQNRPWDAIVRDLVTAKGKRDENPATIFWLSHIEGAKERKLKPAEVAGALTRRFMGTQLQCAECHHHPYENFSQADFWSVAAFFGKTEVDQVEKKQTKAGIEPVVLDHRSGQGAITIPDTNGKLVKATFPYGSEASPLEMESLRTAFADWMTDPDNQPFAMAGVNRLWGHLFGRGIVHPVDDFRPNNPPSHPEVLDKLAEEFVASKFDIKHIIKCICMTKAYQRSSNATKGNEADDLLQSHHAIKLMSTDSLYRSLATVLGKGLASNQRDGKKLSSPKQAMIKLFNTSEERSFSTEYTHGIPQVLRLMNGEFLRQNAPVLARLRSERSSPEANIEDLYLTVLARRPTAEESKQMTELVRRSPNPIEGYTDVMWVLLNSSEFVFNH